ncbi:adenylate/guanylate cyclase domain-containing protein [[Limnothrix rosea] IAM M-220]|uniref:adenylate/guanylate cyclase domain-containing protein n=1 Tax=[Limnothrix rosea] IAM M-220 TaxID=454133 RepID=UPI00095A818F|nr:adenylate/guanylate cyclase domain-containing protein [[Limnothrix rosea] IAM M-220]OKH18746.1 adenylate/guanylate cyclase domain-containing protein [[Limnothrix rosea] IAM M-220]
MTFSNAGSILATLSQFTQFNRSNALTERVQDISINEFVCLLDFITAEFQQFLRALDMINNEALETMLDQIMEAFTFKIGQILKAERTTIFLVDEEQQQLWSKIDRGHKNGPRNLRIPLKLGIAGHVAATAETLNIENAYEHPLFKKDIDERPGLQTKTLLCMPICSSTGKVVAVVQLVNKKGETSFDDQDEERFSEFASSIGIILETCQSFYIAARNQRGASALLKATSSLGQSLDLEATLQAVMEQARKLMQADRSTLFMLSRETSELWSKIDSADRTQKMEVRIPANRGIAGFVASTGQVLNITDAYADPRFDPSTDRRTGYETRTILCMPVFNSNSELIAVTQLINKEQGSFSASDEEFMQAFNIQAGIALENAKLFENVLTEKQYQKDILESLSDAVISTDLQGRIVTINDAALELLGYPAGEHHNETMRQLWECKLVDRPVWEVVPIDNLQARLEDSLQYGAKSYVPEQDLHLASYCPPDRSCLLAVPQPLAPEEYLIWNEEEIADPAYLQPIDRNINLSVNPLTNGEGQVRGGLVVIEDISQEKRMKSTLYRYMTPGVAEQVMALGDENLMVGERRDVTILFSDIRGYTTLTENLEATEVVSLLNQYFETMVESVFDYHGTLDKFIGDALMAVFGAPLPLDDHAWMSIKSALDMRRRLDRFNHRRVVDNQPQIQFGIGISSGEVVSGNIGSQKRMDYTVIGDGVNVSARLESLTKQYLCDIIISEETLALCGDRLWVRELDKIRVKGKSKATKIYEVIQEREHHLTDNHHEFLDLYHRGRAAYMNKDFQRAIAAFKQAHKIHKHDQATLIHLRRAQRFSNNPPGKNWDGIYTMQTK